MTTLTTFLLNADKSAEAAAKELCSKNAELDFHVTVVPSDAQRKNPEHGAERNTTVFRFPLHGDHEQEQNVQLFPEEEQYFRQSPNRSFHVILGLTIVLPSQCQHDVMLFRSPSLPAYDATEMHIKPRFLTDKGWTVRLKFAKKGALQSILFCNKQEDNPGVFEHFFRTWVLHQKQQFLDALHFDQLKD